MEFGFLGLTWDQPDQNCEASAMLTPCQHYAPDCFVLFCSMVMFVFLESFIDLPDNGSEFESE